MVYTKSLFKKIKRVGQDELDWLELVITYRQAVNLQHLISGLEEIMGVASGGDHFFLGLFSFYLSISFANENCLRTKQISV